ncbi:MAG TPA: AMP-binding protein [Ramlibacter sp.]|uniref:acyl-CoA synthetase n=1 Tax=Ramlibacter sp. TaxID=1917967 RepID=UPI002D1156F6|nr:AMP-binding protein [Ramlibacter sp.]HVZ46066.1 AMP-binding protein [Ramlibacter sp.]
MTPSQGRDNYLALHAGLRWLVPERFNIAEACCARWAARADANERIAIRAHGVEGEGATLTYARLAAEANRMSNLLAGVGVHRGDRVAIVMPQRFETAIAYMAVFQLGAVAMPLSILFGPEALQYRLRDSEAVVAICDESSIGNVAEVRSQCPLLREVIGVDGAEAHSDVAWGAERPLLDADFTALRTHSEDGAVLIYTSGTTGPPKGALIPHRALIGNLPGFVCSQNWFGFDPRGRALTEGEQALPLGSDAVFWSPADWAWTGGLMDALLPTLYFGRPIVAYNGRFNPEVAFTLLQEHRVTHTFVFPTALKAMMKAYPEPREHFALQLSAIMSAGEAVGDAVFAYCRDRLGVTVNEMFGQTEMNYVVGNCAPQWPARAGSMGRPYPGHRVAVIDDDGNECPAGVAGDVAVNRFDRHGDPDPVFFLGYWKNEDATRRKFTGDWCRTGDLAVRDEEGYLWYQGRADDVFKAAGYRIGPSEIENCLVKHPAVVNAAVVPKPDRERGAVVKAYVVLAPHVAEARTIAAHGMHAFDVELIAQLQAHVRGRLAPYEYPKEIEFIEALPMTTTGKVQRRVLRLREEEKARAVPDRP